jgi:hypothetical protein
MNVANIGSSKADRKLDDPSGGACPTQESTVLPEMPPSSPVPPQKVEVNTNDILIAFISNLDYMSEAQVTAAVKAIAHLNPNLIRQVLDSPEEF